MLRIFQIRNYIIFNLLGLWPRVRFWQDPYLFYQFLCIKTRNFLLAVRPGQHGEWRSVRPTQPNPAENLLHLLEKAISIEISFRKGTNWRSDAQLGRKIWEIFLRNTMSQFLGVQAFFSLSHNALIFGSNILLIIDV